MALALRVMPVGETVAIIYLAPIGVMGLAAWRLGGKVRPLGWVAALVVFLTLLRFNRPPLWPGLLDTALLGLLGALMTAGHFLFTAGYREAPASVLAPVNYLHLVWAGLLGALVFGHIPDAITAFGMALVTTAGVAVALQAQFGRSTTPGTPSGTPPVTP